MTISELIDELNIYCEENEVCSTNEISGEIAKKLIKLKFSYVTTIDREEHRWYILGEHVYKIDMDNKIYYIGTWEVETLKSEYMSISDCGCLLQFFEMEQYTTVSYREKK